MYVAANNTAFKIKVEKNSTEINLYPIFSKIP